MGARELRGRRISTATQRHRFLMRSTGGTAGQSSLATMRMQRWLQSSKRASQAYWLKLKSSSVQLLLSAHSPPLYVSVHEKCVRIWAPKLFCAST
jgi:hypothetical protein